jgi:signal transduction histidine kinase
MRQLQFMVYEALSNVLQHAHATQLRIELRSTDKGGVRLRMIDNGLGFDPKSVKRRGLGSLRDRAASIDAAMTITSAPGNTVVEFMLV